jgi:amino acid adenylation domain-containing protein
MSQNTQGFRLSPQQRTIWLAQQENPACRAQAALTMTGDLDPERLRSAVQAAVRRHDMLRTTFHRAPGVKVPIQIVAEEAGVSWESADLAGLPDAEQEVRLDDLFRRQLRRPFDLEQGPLLGCILAVLAPQRHVLILGLPGLCADSWTLAILVREIGEQYAAARSGDDEVVQYLQYSEWHHEMLDDEEGRAGRERWSGLDLSGFLGLRLPLEGVAGTSGVGARGFTPARLPVRLEPGVAARLERLAKEAGSSLPAALLALWHGLLFRLTREPVLVIGEVLDGRKLEDFHGIVGPFARIVPVPCELDDALSFRELLERVERARAGASDWQESFLADSLLDPSMAGRGAPVVFELLDPPAAGRLGGAAFSVRDWIACLERFKMKLSCMRTGGELRGEIQFDPRLFREADVARLADRFAEFLQSVLERPGMRLAELEVVDPGEMRERLEACNRTEAAFPADRCLHQLFTEQAARTPDRLAVAAGEARFSYAELERGANRLAHHLRDLGVGPELRVGLCLSRSADLVTAILAVLKAGGAYLPLDPSYPAERLAWMLEDSRPVAVVTEEGLAAVLPDRGVPRIVMEAERERLAARSAEPPAVDVGPENLAYVMYTSGSTGRPKGVMVPHRGLVNYLSWCRIAYATDQGMGAPVHSPIGFDLTVTSLFSPLLAGGCAVLLPEAQGVQALSGALRDSGGYTLVKVTPSHLELLGEELEDAELAGRTDVLVVGGEALSGATLAAWRKHAPETRLINEYGPTETVVGSCVYEVPPGPVPAAPVPIGKPIANTRVYVVDPWLQAVSFGVAGELVIGGAGVTRGYQGGPELTAERFVPDLFGAAPGDRLYRTGDLARFLPDGNLEYLGRSDRQVKIRSYRVELGEIEAVLAGHPGVREAVVLLREDRPGDRRLVGYLVPAGDKAPRFDELRRFLAESLPEPMVPGWYVSLPALPLTAHGKLDRLALPVPGPDRPELEQAYVAPRNPLEEVLAGIWAEVLGVDQVGALDSFFALGGDSIRSVRVVALAKQRGLELTVQDLFRHQTVAELAGHLAAFTGLPAASSGGESLEGDSTALASLLDDLEGLSDEAVQARLRERLRGAGEAP